MNSFSSRIYKIGVNPYVTPTTAVLEDLFRQAGKTSGPIPVRGKLNGHPFQQTLVKFSSKWRLYLNTPMRRSAGIDVGDKASVEIEFDPGNRDVPVHPDLQSALNKNKTARAAFAKLTASRQKEIKRYINHLKTKASVEKNIERVLHHLLKKGKFAGRKDP